MRKTLNGKLTLHRESLRHLEPRRLATVKGMSDLCTGPTCFNACTHSCRTPTCTC
jgi:hypothetical protein